MVDALDKLIQLAYPELAVKQELSVTALSVARKFYKLSKEMQRAILAIIQSTETAE